MKLLSYRLHFIYLKTSASTVSGKPHITKRISMLGTQMKDSAWEPDVTPRTKNKMFALTFKTIKLVIRRATAKKWDWRKSWKRLVQGDIPSVLERDVAEDKACWFSTGKRCDFTYARNIRNLNSIAQCPLTRTLSWIGYGGVWSVDSNHKWRSSRAPNRYLCRWVYPIAL